MTGEKGGGRASPVSLVHTCYKAVDCSKEKYFVNGRSSHPGVFYKKVLLKEVLPIYTEKYLRRSLF